MGGALEALAAILVILCAMFATLSGGAAYEWSVLALRLGVVAAFALWLVSALLRGRAPLPTWPALAAFGLYLGWVGLATWHSDYRHASLGGFGNQAVWLAGLFVAASTWTPKRQAWWATAFAITALLHGAYGLAQGFGVKFTATYTQESSSTYFNSNHYAGFLDLSIPVGFVLALLARSWTARIGWALLTALLLSNHLTTFSGSWGGRLAVLVTLIGAFALWLLRTQHPKWLVGFCIGLFALGGVATYAVSSTATISTRVAAFWAEFDTLVMQPRLTLYSGVLRIAAEHPLYGVGPGNFTREMPKQRTAKNDESGRVTHYFVNYAHNDTLQTAAETGWPAVVLFAIGTATALIAGRGHPAIKAGIVCLLLHGLVDANFTYIVGNAFLGWVYLGLALPAVPVRSGNAKPATG